MLAQEFCSTTLFATPAQRHSVPAQHTESDPIQTTPPMTFAPGQTVVLTAYNASALPALVQIAFVDLAGEVLEFRERKLEACRGEAMTLLGGPVHVDAPSSASNGNPAGRRGVVGFLRIRREPSGVGTTPTAVSLSMQIVDLATGRTQGYWGNAARA